MSAAMDQNIPIGDPTDALSHHEDENPIVFLDVAVGSEEVGRITLELFADVCPRTAENFRQFCTGEYRKDRKPIGYKDAIFHRVIKDFMIQGGDFLNNDGTGCTSIYGDAPFEDESLGALRHSGPGVLAMANSGPNTNGNQFYITCTQCDFLDSKHVVFGKVVNEESLLVVRKLENVPAGKDSRPTSECKIMQCGEM